MEHIKLILNFEKNTNNKIVLKELFNSDVHIVQSYKTANSNTSKYKTTLLHEHNPSLDILISIIPV